MYLNWVSTVIDFKYKNDFYTNVAIVFTKILGIHVIQLLQSEIRCRIANKKFLLKLLAGKTFPAFPAHAQPAILIIW